MLYFVQRDLNRLRNTGQAKFLFVRLPVKSKHMLIPKATYPKGFFDMLLGCYQVISTEKSMLVNKSFVNMYQILNLKVQWNFLNPLLMYIRHLSFLFF